MADMLTEEEIAEQMYKMVAEAQGVKQLKPGGRMITPVGSAFMVQQLVLIEKSKGGEVTLKQILPVRFVPLTGEHGD